MLQGSRPTASTAAATPGNGVDYQAGAVDSETCTFTYRQDAPSGANRLITYEADSGNVTVTGADE